MPVLERGNGRGSILHSHPLSIIYLHHRGWWICGTPYGSLQDGVTQQCFQPTPLHRRGNLSELHQNWRLLLRQEWSWASSVGNLVWTPQSPGNLGSRLESCKVLDTSWCVFRLVVGMWEEHCSLVWLCFFFNSYLSVNKPPPHLVQLFRQ